MSDSTSTPPGWYASGTPEQERWWDGQSWTENVRPTPLPVKSVDSQKLTFSLVGAIISALLIFPSGLSAALTLKTSGLLSASIPALACIVFVIATVFLFWNYNRLNKQLKTNR